MAETISPEVRSRMMSGIRGTNTKPEMQIRSGPHAAGFRFRLHGRGLPGRPDLILPKWGAVVFVHGCFWHGQRGCPYFRIPKTRTEFWTDKIAGNALRDERAVLALLTDGWLALHTCFAFISWPWMGEGHFGTEFAIPQRGLRTSKPKFNPQVGMRGIFLEESPHGRGGFF